MKILVDTSAWIEHFKGSTKAVRELLEDDQAEILTHTMVIAELMLGGIKSDSEAMSALLTQDYAVEASSEEMLLFIEQNSATLKKVGYVDCCLLAACVLSNAKLLTFDKGLKVIARDFDLSE